MKQKLTENQKRLIYTDCFKFTLLGRYNIYITPYGSKEYKIVCRGFRMFFDENTDNNIAFGKEPTYKEFYKTKSIYDAVTLFNAIVITLVNTFKDFDYSLEMDSLTNNSQYLLKEIKEQL